MAYLIDCLETKTEIDGKWVIARPMPGPFLLRLKDAWLVAKGEADAVRFYGQPHNKSLAADPKSMDD